MGNAGEYTSSTDMPDEVGISPTTVAVSVVQVTVQLRESLLEIVTWAITRPTPENNSKIAKM
jgi:hypothetical protein